MAISLNSKYWTLPYANLKWGTLLRAELTIYQILVIVSFCVLFDISLSYREIDASTGIKFEHELIPDFNIVAAGDWDCNSNTQKTVRNILQKDPELVIGLGDYVYKQDSADCWIGVIEPLRDIIKIVIGNHEVKSPKILEQIMNYLGIDYFGVDNQQYYYSFDIHNLHFLVLSDYSPFSSEEFPQGYKKGSEQYEFIENDLARSVSNPEIDWIIVSHHVQQYASTFDSIVYPADEWVETYHPLFEKYDVDLVLQAHQHNYQRTFPIQYNSKNPVLPLVSDNNATNYSDPQGQIFATIGTAGAQLQNLNGTAPYITTHAIKFGFLNIDIMKNGTSLNATFLSNEGSINDKFTISKSQ
jgi:predicted MPP superfamily phosphohydrolase